jgi:four helix bundle protein
MKSKIESFEDLYVYQRAREFSRKIADVVKKLPKNETNKLKDQMTRARRSITNNIAEGYGRYHYQENIQYNRYSRGSICEIVVI